LKKDAHNFLSVIEANRGIIYKVAHLYCKNEEDKKDLIQEIIVQLWRSFDKYNEQYKLSTWIYRIALNVSISSYRREKRRKDIHHPLPEDILYIEEENSQTGADNIAHLHRFIRELREIDRALILLYLEGRNHEEIAAILGLTTTNISTKVSRIKQQLKQKFSTLQL
jgi:RNA polymerase sigma factor (sigma-70 family)